MTDGGTASCDAGTSRVAWHAMTVTEATDRLGVDTDAGLDAREIDRRLDQFGPNELPAEPLPG